MFSRLYQSAKAIFTDTPQNEKIQPSVVVEPLRDETMVTTRQRNTQDPIEDKINEENSINVYVPSSAKRQPKRTKDESVVVLSDDDEAEFKPPSTKKRKRLPVRAKDVESPDPGKTRPVVEIPAKKSSPEPEQGNEVTIREEVEDTKAQHEAQDVGAAGPLERSKHRHFESEEAEHEFFSTAREAIMDEGDGAIEAVDSREVQDSEDSEDDAPEAVGIQEAAKAVKLKDRDAAKVVKE
jgi:U3 small nucleolar RNA-associated protein 16